MKLPAFLRFLEPRVQKPIDGLGMRGHIRVERTAGGIVELVHDSPNFIVDAGLEAVADLLIGSNGGGFEGSIFRMAVGDGGSVPGDILNPKLPDATWPGRTGLFHEILRKDINTFTRPTANSMRFQANFNPFGLVDASGYSLADKVVNEASLIIGDGVLTVGDDPRQINKTSPDSVDGDEVMLSMRTFRSASFDEAEDVTITITWTITVAKAA